MARVVDIDAEQVMPDTQFSDFADSLTMMRFRKRMKRDLRLDISVEQLLEADTVKVLAARISSQTTTSTLVNLNILVMDLLKRTHGELDVAAEIQQKVTKVMTPYGFSWEEDVGDVLSSWDLGYEVFGFVAGTAKSQSWHDILNQNC